jgi:hypothetical protein
VRDPFGKALSNKKSHSPQYTMPGTNTRYCNYCHDQVPEDSWQADHAHHHDVHGHFKFQVRGGPKLNAQDDNTKENNNDNDKIKTPVKQLIKDDSTTCCAEIDPDLQAWIDLYAQLPDATDSVGVAFFLDKVIEYLHQMQVPMAMPLVNKNTNNIEDIDE